MAAIEKLRKALKKKVVDEFAEGSVIRFKSGGRYTYAVIKAGGRWWITSCNDFFGVGQGFTYEELLDEVLSNAGVEEIEVAESWILID